MAFKKGQSGNPNGRPKGVSTRTTMISKALHERSDEWVNKVINMGLAGDTVCLKLWGDKIIANAKKDMEICLPNLVGKTPEQLARILFEAMSGQSMSLEEINSVLDIIKKFKSNDDSAAIQEVIDKSNTILDELRAKNEREY
jgi:hypothetical protein